MSENWVIWSHFGIDQMPLAVVESMFNFPWSSLTTVDQLVRRRFQFSARKTYVQFSKWENTKISSFAVHAIWWVFDEFQHRSFRKFTLDTFNGGTQSSFAQCLNQNMKTLFTFVMSSFKRCHLSHWKCHSVGFQLEFHSPKAIAKGKKCLIDLATNDSILQRNARQKWMWMSLGLVEMTNVSDCEFFFVRKIVDRITGRLISNENRVVSFLAKNKPNNLSIECISMANALSGLIRFAWILQRNEFISNWMNLVFFSFDLCQRTCFSACKFFVK